MKYVHIFLQVLAEFACREYIHSTTLFLKLLPAFCIENDVHKMDIYIFVYHSVYHPF